MRTVSSFDREHPETGRKSPRVRAISAHHSAFSSSNHGDESQGQVDGARALRLASLREARVSHIRRTAGQRNPSAKPGSGSPPKSEIAPPPRVAVAAALLQHLEPDQLSALGAYEEMVISELGQYALDAAAAQPSPVDSVSGALPDPRIETPFDSPAPADHSGSSVDAAALSDSYLRATLGFERYNQLSFMAAARAAEARRAAAPAIAPNQDTHYSQSH